MSSFEGDAAASRKLELNAAGKHDLDSFSSSAKDPRLLTATNSSVSPAPAAARRVSGPFSNLNASDRQQQNNNNNNNNNDDDHEIYRQHDEDDDEDDDALSDASSAPSTLYARCRAAFASNVHSAVMVRRLKRTIDSDVTFLNNRLSKLRHEEERSRQEIAQLRKKRSELQSTMSRQSDTHNKRKALQDQVDFAKRKEAALIALSKEKQAKAVWASRQKIIQRKRESVMALRKQKEMDELKVQIIREEQREKNAKVREAIRQLHVAARDTRERLAEEQREQSRLVYAQRLEQEQRECAEKEKYAAELVAQEAELVYRLKKMDDEKKRVLGDLMRNSLAADGSGGGGSRSPNRSQSRAENSSSNNHAAATSAAPGAAAASIGRGSVMVGSPAVARRGGATPTMSGTR